MFIRIFFLSIIRLKLVPMLGVRDFPANIALTVHSFVSVTNEKAGFGAMT